MQFIATPHSHKAELIGCPSCDGLTRVPVLQPGDTAYCSECGLPLSQCLPNSLDKVIAYAITAFVLLIAANLLPFLSLRAAGAENVITLPSTSISLLHDGMPILALLVCSFILLLPMTQLVLVLMLYIPLKLAKPAPWLISSGRLVFTLQSWCMVDVFLIALVVSLVKLMTMASIGLGIAFWAYVAFAICFTLMQSAMDRLECWRAIETLTSTESHTVQESGTKRDHTDSEGGRAP